MNRRRIVALLTLVVLFGLWWAWPSAGPEAPGAEASAGREVRRRVLAVDAAPDPSDPRAVVAKALAFCAACASGEEEGPACAACTGEIEPVPEEEPEEPETTELVVDVINEDGRPEDRAFIRIRGCPVLGRDGNVFQVALGLECVVLAYRRDGVLQVPSEEVRLFPEPGGSYVQLEMQRVQRGGLGVRFANRPDGIEVLRVTPGSPAEVLGLAPGDVITEVGGRSTSGLSNEAFIREMTGPVGSEVRFRVRDPSGAESEMVLEREWLPQG